MKKISVILIAFLIISLFNNAFAYETQPGDLIKMAYNRIDEKEGTCQNIYTEDYDNDGKPEAFVLVGNADYNCFKAYGSLYYINSRGEYSLITNQLAGETNGFIVSALDKKFLVYEKSFGGSGTWSMVYGVNNGNYYELNMDGGVSGFYQSGERYFCSESDFSKGYHDWIEKELYYNKSLHDFTFTIPNNEIDIVGNWRIDTEKTTQANGSNMFDMFGSAWCNYGDKMTLGNDFSFSYFIGAGVGGEGQYYDGSHSNGSKILYRVTEYETNESYNSMLTIEGDELVMILGEMTIYWKSSNVTPKEKEQNTEISLSINATKTDKSELEKITYDADDSTYNIDSFLLNGEITNLNYLIDAAAKNVDVQITLPKGYSFKKDGNENSKTIHYDSISAMAYFNETVYLDDPEIGKEEGQIHISGDNIPEKDYKFYLEVSAYIFEVNKYRADYLIDSSTGQNAKAIEKTFNGSTPATVFYEGGKESNLDLSVDFWKTIQNADKLIDNPSKVFDVALEKKDMYEGILWNVFETSCSSELIDEMDDVIENSGKDVYDSLTKYFKKIYNMDITNPSEFKKMSSSQKKDFLDKLDKNFSSHYEGLDNVMRMSDFVGDISSAVSDAYTVCKAASSYYMMYSLNDSIKQVMREMYQQCPADNLSLKAALLNCITVMNSNEKQFMADVGVMVTLNAGNFVAQACVGKLWSGVKAKVIATHPYAAAFMIAYEGGTFISNTLFNTDEICESYTKLGSITDIKLNAIDAYNAIKKKYNSDKTEFNAETYNSSIDILYSILNEDCKTATAFIDAYDETVNAKISAIFGNTTTEKRKGQIESVQNSYYLDHEAVLRNWVFQLEADNPKKYKQYKNLVNESMNKIYKKYEISCPVDVYVYDKSNQLVGSVVNNVASVKGKADISVIADNDKKIVYLDNNKYSLKYVGNGNGSMDIKITVFENDNNERSVYFNDIPLQTGTEYTSAESGNLSQEYKLKPLLKP